MQIEKVLKVGDQLEIISGDISVKTKVQDIKGDLISVLEPTYQMVPLKIDGPVKMRFYRPNGIFSFWAKPEGKQKAENLELYVFRSVSELEKRQRRQTFRLPIALDAEIIVQGEGKKRIKARTVDLSAGGICFTCFEELIKEQEITIMFRLLDGSKMTLKARIIRCEAAQVKGGVLTFAAKFIDISSNDQSAISRFIIKRQIEQQRQKL